jgi:hypothetical protein
MHTALQITRIAINFSSVEPILHDKQTAVYRHPTNGSVTSPILKCKHIHTV